MMDSGQIAGLVGGLIGCLIGIAGGVVGTYFSIKNTNGPLERAYMVNVSVMTWVAVILFLLLLLLLPKPYNFLMWIPYGIFLPLGIYKINKRVSELRRIEKGD